MLCKKDSSAIFTATWQIYYPDCRKRFFFCNAGAGAYLPAVTVCYQKLYDPFGLTQGGNAPPILPPVTIQTLEGG